MRLTGLLTAGIAAAIAGCGFHFSGSRPLPEPLRSVYIDVVTPYTVSKPELESALRARLTRRGADVTGRPGDARSQLRLSGLTENRQVLSVDPYGKAVEYQLTMSVHYELHAGGEVIAGPGDLDVSRDYSFNAQQVLAKEAEEARLQDFIQGELAEVLLLKLETVLSHPAAPVTEPAAAPATVPDAKREP